MLYKTLGVNNLEGKILSRNTGSDGLDPGVPGANRGRDKLEEWCDPLELFERINDQRLEGICPSSNLNIDHRFGCGPAGFLQVYNGHCQRKTCLLQTGSGKLFLSGILHDECYPDAFSLRSHCRQRANTGQHVIDPASDTLVKLGAISLTNGTIAVFEADLKSGKPLKDALNA